MTVRRSSSTEVRGRIRARINPTTINIVKKLTCSLRGFAATICTSIEAPRVLAPHARRSTAPSPRSRRVTLSLLAAVRDRCRGIPIAYSPGEVPGTPSPAG